MMNEVNWSKVELKFGGEKFRFLYNREKQEIYNEWFPGICIEKVTTLCGHHIPHSILLKIIQEKAQEFELAIAKSQLTQAIEDFKSKDYSQLF